MWNSFFHLFPRRGLRSQQWTQSSTPNDSTSSCPTSYHRLISHNPLLHPGHKSTHVFLSSQLGVGPSSPPLPSGHYIRLIQTFPGGGLCFWPFPPTTETLSTIAWFLFTHQKKKKKIAERVAKWVWIISLSSVIQFFYFHSFSATVFPHASTDTV